MCNRPGCTGIPNCSNTNQRTYEHQGPPSESNVIDFAYPLVAAESSESTHQGPSPGSSVLNSAYSLGTSKDDMSTTANETSKAAEAPENTTPSSAAEIATPTAIKKPTMAAITDQSLLPLPVQQMLLPTVFKGNHPAFRETPAPKAVDTAISTLPSRSATPDSASAATDSNETNSSDASNKFVGGSHQMNDVKLPGYWTHERTAELREMAKQESDAAANATVDGSGEDPKAAGPQCTQCEEEEKSKGLFKEEFKKKKFLQKLFRRKA